MKSKDHKIIKSQEHEIMKSKEQKNKGQLLKLLARVE